MAKRAANKQLTQDNWDEDDDEKETPGTYKSVEASTLQNRVIKKAKRSLPNTTDGISCSPSRNPFGHFKGFGASMTKAQPFGFLKNNWENSFAQDPVINVNKAKPNGSKPLSASENSSEPSTSTKDAISPNWKKCESRHFEYYRQLKALNASLMKWVEVHMTKNPCCDFTPVFDDYKKHLAAIEKKYPLQTKPLASPYLSKPFLFKVPSAPVQRTCNTVPEAKLKSGEPATKISKLENSASASGEMAESAEMCYGAGFKSNTTNTSTFSFGIKATTTATVPSSNSGPTSSCGTSEKDSEENEHTPTFTFSVAKSSGQSPDVTQLSGKSGIKTFSFAASPFAKSNDSSIQSNDEKNGDDEYVPPKNEVTAVKEEDALYSKKCRLFYKKNESYVEKGVGMLYLKPREGNTQLLIRADTNLGNILLNIKLCASLPMQRMGKNNVLVVCVPNPPLIPGNSESKETASLLIRVKTSDDADELLGMLNRHKS